MKISVAMCTYNGARFLDEQLQSLATQSRLPDELIVCDDGSQDETPQIIGEFAACVPFEVRVFHNETNLGPIRNFEKAIGLCRGDIILPCDQDDVWFSHKLQSLEATFKRFPRVGLVWTAVKIGDEIWPPRPHRKRFKRWKCSNDAAHEYSCSNAGRAFDALMKRNLVTGAAMAFRSRFRDLALPLAEGILMHDAWIALVIAAVSDARFDWRPSMQYRQHEKQHTKTVETISGLHSRRVYYAAYIQQLETLHSRLQNAVAWSAFGARDLNRKQAKIKAKIKHLQARHDLCDEHLKRLPMVAREIASGRYSRYSNGLKSVAVDLLR